MIAIKKSYRRYRAYEHLLLLAVVGLVLLGIVMVFSSSFVVAYRKFGDPYYFFKRHLLFVAMGSFLCGFLWTLPSLKEFLNSKVVYLFLLFVFLLLITTLTPLGYVSGGASRWIRIGPFSIQPLEFAKIALVFYLAYFYTSKGDLIKSIWGFLIPFLITSFLAMPLVFQPDFGGFLILFMIFFAMAFVGGIRLRYIFYSCVLLFGAGAFLVFSAPYRYNRLISYISSLKGIDHLSYQIKQSIYALGCGGFWGVGLGESKQKLFYLPEAFTDFVLSILGEELGFLGVSFVFICIGLIMFVVFTNVIQREDVWDKLVVLGLGMIIVIGALLHIAVVLGAVPPKGTPMPFISYGGSNLLAMFMCVGFILNTIKDFEG